MQSGIDTTGRLAAFTGVLFFACVIAAPDPHRGVENPSAEQLKQFYLDSQQSFRTSLLLVGLAYAFFLVFVAVLRTRLSRAEGGSSTLSNLVLGAGVLVAGFSVFGTALRVVPAFGLVTQTTDAADVRIWGLFADASFNTLIEASTFWRGVMLGAIGLIVVRYGGLPRWLGWTAAVVASGALTAPVLDWLETPVHAAGPVVGLGSHIAFHLWILAASVVMVGVSVASRSRPKEGR